MDGDVTFEAVIQRPGLVDAVIVLTAGPGEPPAALRGRAWYRDDEVWEVFVLDDSTDWPRRAVYRLVDRMDDDGDPLAEGT